MNYVDFMRRVDGKPERVAPVTPPPEHTYSGLRRTVHCEYIRDALNGVYSSLKDAFTWRYTPQGYPYWSTRSGGNVPLSNEDEQYLLWLLEEYS
jgi:hypothetical protein